MLMYFCLPIGSKQIRLLGAITAIWTAFLLIAVWLRKNWARYTLIFILLLNTIISMIFIPSAISIVGEINSGIFIMIVVGITNTAIAWFLIYSRDIKRLTNRFFD